MTNREILGGLHGKRVVNTRAKHQAQKLDDLLREYGATPISYPCIDIVPPEDVGALDAALQAAAKGAFDWLVLTSSNTVNALADRMQALNIYPTALRGELSVAAVGPATALAALDKLDLQVSVIPEDYIAESLAEAISPAKGKRVLLPQSAIARSTLTDMLTDAGANVTVVDAYRTTVGTGGDDLPKLLQSGEVDALTFTSSSTARNFVRRLGAEGVDPSLLIGVGAACIGPKAAATAEGHDLHVVVVPEDHTLAAMVAKLDWYFYELELA